MKKIEAIINSEKLERLQKALEKVGYPGMTVTEVSGHGSQKGTLQQWQNGKLKIEFLPKTKIEIVIEDERVELILNAIAESVGSTGVGSGKVFVTEVFDALRIRTRERGEQAIAC